ncbi:hypothetical protein R3P38DRAFT_3413899 [Favolaschia claudopus]|uniref:Uncharacterized protein n=1 Tax=Favolaschia claudopus TaxID=2862362 RepID=A0AAV9Z1J1_9AGAR
MHHLYLALHMQSQPPPKEQVKLAKGAIPVDSEAAKEYLGKVEMAMLSIIKGLEEQAKKARGDFDQALFDTLFAEWMVTCDQPFDEVEKPEFIWLMEYTHHGSTLNFRVPGCKAITTRIMKMGEDTVDGTSKMFQELKPKVSLSSISICFFATVAHYVTNDGRLAELLIDFQELMGEHSGKNMAEVMWKTILTIVADNASRHEEQGIIFDAAEARIQCMPHTAHLAAVKLLAAIGVISKSNKKKAESRTSAYQDYDSVSTPLAPENDDDGECEEEDKEEDAEVVGANKLKAVVKSEASTSGKLGRVSLMLILDVRTGWSSTHQMLREFSSVHS